MRTDLRLALRMFFKQPGFMLIAVLTLALGIGSTSAVFSLIQGVLLTPPPYRLPERLVLVHSLGSDGQPSRQGWAALQWTDWQRQAKSLEGVAAYDLQLPDRQRWKRVDAGHGSDARVFQHHRAAADSGPVFR